MKIAMFGQKRIPSREGGVEIVAEELATRMAALGHCVTCYNRSGHHVGGTQYDAAPVSDYKGVQCKTVWTLERKGLAAVTSSFFAALCAAFSDADVVHIHAEGPAFMAWLPKLFGKRVVVTIHGLDWKRDKWKGGFGARYIKAGEKMAVRFADQIIVLSQNAQKYFRNTYGRETVYIPNGIVGSDLLDDEKISQVYGLSKDSYILFLGRLVPEKGIHYLIEAFRSVNTSKKLVIAGGLSDSKEYADKLQIMAKGDGRIIMTGFVQGQILSELYSNAYLYCLPSDVEGMPLTLLEAMSYGNCCLVSDIPECTEMAQEKAVTFAHGNVCDLKDKLQMLCDTPTLVQGYRMSAREFVLERYCWDDITERTLRLYHENTDGQ